MFLRAAVFLPAVSVSLKILGFQATQKSLFGFLRDSANRPHLDFIEPFQENEHARLAARMVNAAVYHIWPASSCLEKSLALWWILRTQGICSELRIGGRKIKDKFEAHAWVEREGAALNEPQQEHRHYAKFDSTFPLEVSKHS
jgi:hypothetical protein